MTQKRIAPAGWEDIARMHGSRAVIAVRGVLWCTAAMIATTADRPATAGETEPNECCDCTCYGRYELGGWQVYETKNFRLHFVGREPHLGELARVCERTRVSLRRIWLAAEADESWAPKCDVFLYSDPRHYARCSGLPADTRGTSNLEIGFGKVWNRRIHMRIDQPGYLEHVLPHELTHVVLADRFNTRQIPRWADEGIAMLSEPLQRRNEAAHTIAKARQAASMIPLRELLAAKSYPADLARASVFFAQSIALVDYIVTLRSEAELVRLIEIADRSGYDQAIRELFSLDGVADLESDWTTWLTDRIRSRATSAKEASAVKRTLKGEQKRPGG